MARTFPLRAPYNDTGIPYGPLTADTGDPLGAAPTPAVPETTEVTLTGTPQAFAAAVPETYDVTVAGTPQAAASAVVDIWTAAVVSGGPLTDGDTFTVNIAVGAGSPYVGTFHTGDSPADVFNPIITAIGLDGFYTAAWDDLSFTLTITAVAAGAGHVISVSTTSMVATFGPAVNDQPGQAAVLASTAGVTTGTHGWSATYSTGTVDDLATSLASIIDGSFGYSASAAGAVVSVSGPFSYMLTDISTNGVTATPVQTDPGSAEVPASIAAVSDGVTTYSFVYTSGTLDDMATGLAAAIDGQAGYTAAAVGAVVTVDGPYSYVLTNDSENGVTATPVITVPGSPFIPGTGDLTTNSPYVMSLTNVTAAGIWCELQAGTSCVVVPWYLDPTTGIWAAQSPTTVTANTVILLNTAAVSCLFVEQKTFVGGATVLVSCRGNDTRPGY